MTDTPHTTRRRFLATSIAAPAALTAAAPAAQAQDRDTYVYEVQRTEEAWRARLDDTEYFILREGGTEVPHSSLNAFREPTEVGVYACKGCDLALFESNWKVVKARIGWAFWTQCVPTAVMTSIDGDAYGNTDPNKAPIEAHCRRCGSHMGHILTVEGQTLYCINGSAVDFHAA